MRDNLPLADSVPGVIILRGLWNMLKFLAVVAVIVGGMTGAAHAASPESYCRSTGGQVVVRIPAYGTNNPNPLLLAHPQPFCRYTEKKGQSHIEVVLSTLTTAKPTLAALAYYAAVAPNLSSCVGNPASCYCSQIGGTDLFGGITAAGGGWVLNTNVSNALDVCTFPDLSMIDSWGLTYHAAGIIRGIDLSKVLVYPNPY